MIAIFRKTGKQIHADGTAVAAEDAGKAIVKGDNGTVENTVGALVSMSSDDGVSTETPDRFRAGLRFVLPGTVGERSSGENMHDDASFHDSYDL